MAKICTINGCGRPHLWNGWCSTHYARYRNHGDVMAHIPILERTKKICKVEGCGRPHNAHGYCDTHNKRIMRTGQVKEKMPISYSHLASESSNWKGGKISDGRGRILIYSPNHPARMGGYVFRYRLVMEKYLGRYLKSNEVVHHINENPSDDRLENLKVMTHSSHMKHHALKRAAEKPETDWNVYGHTLTLSNIEKVLIRMKVSNSFKLHDACESLVRMGTPRILNGEHIAYEAAGRIIFKQSKIGNIVQIKRGLWIWK